MPSCLPKEDQALVDAIRASSPSLGTVLEKRLSKTKSMGKSKLYYLGLIIVVLGTITDPMFRVAFGDIIVIPPNVLSKITFLLGCLIMIFRVFAQNTKIDISWLDDLLKKTKESCR